MEVTANQDNLINLTSNKVDYFALKDHGHFAYIRFLYDVNEEAVRTTIHKIKQTNPKNGNQYDASINCLFNGEKGSCPLCDAGHRQITQVYVKVSEVQKDGTEVFKLWSQNYLYLDTIQTLIEKYPSGLYKTIWLIKRNGLAGKASTYDRYVEKTQPEITLEELPEIKSPIGTIVREYTYAELDQFVKTGIFPTASKTKTSETPQENPYTNIPKLPTLQTQATKTNNDSF